MSELPLNPTLLQDLEAAYQRNVDTGRVALDATHDLGATAAAAATENQHNDGETSVDDLNLTPEQEQLAEELRDQLEGISTGAYIELADALGVDYKGGLLSPFEDQLVQWAKNGTLDYLNESMEANPGLTFSLVISPNEVVSKTELYVAAHRFAQGQDNPTGGKWAGASVDARLYDQYSDAALCGDPIVYTDEQTPDVRFTLIPNKFTSSIPRGSALNQRDAFEQYRHEETEGRLRNDMTLKTPSLLDSIAWWYTLREEQRVDSRNPTKSLSVKGFRDTYIRHLDLSPVLVNDRFMLTGNCVDRDGRPILDGIEADVGFEGVRIAAG